LNLKKIIPNAFRKDEIYLESLFLIRHLKIGVWKNWRTRVRIWASAPTVWGREEWVLSRFGLRMPSIYGQFQNKITLIP
jgi:hypothetical protein